LPLWQGEIIKVLLWLGFGFCLLKPSLCGFQLVLIETPIGQEEAIGLLRLIKVFPSNADCDSLGKS